jgi:ribosomal protein S13
MMRTIDITKFGTLYHHLLGLKVKGQRSENHRQGSKAKSKIVKKHLLKYKKQVKKEIFYFVL